MLKKTLSFVMSFVMLISCFSMLSGTVVFAEKTKTETGLADEINPQVKFFVPETIYLDISDRKTFKYIYGSDTDGAAVKDEQSNSVYFDGLNCSPESVKITLMTATAESSEDYTAVDSTGISSVTLGANTMTGEQAANDGISSSSFPFGTTLDAGVLSAAVTAGKYKFIRWQADYVVNGQTYTTYAYSICYSHHSNYAYLRQNSRTYTSNFKSSARVQAEMQIDGLNSGSVSAEQGSRDYAKSSDNSGGTLSRSASFVVDVSRFTNYSKIPYLAARDNIIFHNGGDYTYVTLSAGNTSKSVGGGQTKNNGWWNYTAIDLPTDGTRITFYMRAHSRYNGKDVDNYTYVYVTPTNVDKTELQKSYYDAVSASRQRGWYSEGFDEYQNSILAAAIVVGNPSATDVSKTINTDVLVYNEYNVIFVDSDSTVLSEETIDFGSYASAPEVSTEPSSFDDDYHYAFTGWDNDVTAPVTGDIVFTAQYGAIAHEYKELVSIVTDATCASTGKAVFMCVCSKTAELETPIDPDNHDLIHHEAKTPTCTENGWYEYDTCSRCDYTTFVSIDKVAHTEGTAVKENVVLPTCEDDGSYDEVVYCTECNEELSREAKTIPALGHDLIHHEGKAATCTESGWYEYDTCSRCDYTTYIVIDKIAHTPGEAVKENIVDATCEDDGSYDEVVYCTECNKELLREAKVINALGHDLIHHDEKASTCTETGWYAYDTCSRCDYTTFTVMEKAPHTYGEPVKEKEVSATCLDDGSYDEVVYCEVCNAELSREAKVIPALGHDLVHYDAKPATCTEFGWNEYDACSRCDYNTYEEIPVDSNAHKYGEWTVVTEPGCLTDGLKQRVCEYNPEHVDSAVIPSAGHHTWDDGVVTKEATCSSTGVKLVTCTACSETADVEIPVNSDAHKFDYVEATCTSDGEKRKVCEYNDEHYIAEATPALGHDYVNHDAMAPTCETDGYKAYVTCSRCDYTTFEKVEKLGHDYSILLEHKDSTCSERGYDLYLCSRSDSTLYKFYELKEHSWDNGVVTTEPTAEKPGVKTYTCTECGATKTVPLYKCSHCDKVFEGDDAYNEHLEYVKTLCPYCGEKHDKYLEHMTFVKLKCFLTRLFKLLFGWFKDMGAIAVR